jgi:glycosyltransferase involved in cell wall biosynthesis
VEASRAGRAIAPDDPDAFVTAVASMVADVDGLRRMGADGRRWVENAASPRAVAEAYVELIRRL